MRRDPVRCCRAPTGYRVLSAAYSIDGLRLSTHRRGPAQGGRLRKGGVVLQVGFNRRFWPRRDHWPRRREGAVKPRGFGIASYNPNVGL